MPCGFRLGLEDARGSSSGTTGALDSASHSRSDAIRRHSGNGPRFLSQRTRWSRRDPATLWGCDDVWGWRHRPPWLGNPQVEIHGPGYSKLLLDTAESEAFARHIDLLVDSVAANGGRSCINASAVRCVSHSREIADAMAQQIAQIVPKPRDADDAALAAFADRRIAESVNGAIERGLAQGGAEDITARYRGTERLVEFHGGTYLLPTVIHCESMDHPLANQEFMFPFVSVTEVGTDCLVETLGPSLVLSAITDDPTIRRQLLARADIGRLNLGPIPTQHIQWDQPHEGNLFELLYQQRAFQIVNSAV